MIYRFGLATGGAYAEYIATPASMIVRKPDHVSWVQAAAVMENWLTAFQGTVFLSVPPDPQKHQTHVLKSSKIIALFTISEMQKGQSVLVHAGASGVGIAAIQLAKAFGA